MLRFCDPVNSRYQQRLRPTTAPAEPSAVWSLLGQVVIPIVAVAAIALAIGGRAWGHDIYTGLKSPVTGVSCCGGRDCQPATLCSLPGGVEGVVIAGQCAPLDYRLVIDSPDGAPHICIRGGKVVCIPMPLGA